MQDEKHQPYFFNPDMTAEQPEDWLEQKKLHLTHFNRLVKEKTALEERLTEISSEIEWLSTGGFEEKLSFLWDPSPLLRNRQQDND
ncbi:hypothetical protein F384_12745 [Citrobacter amalonaticus Y19]|uniref:Uncharacterized protein n=1 Tax=Citrobacter amalonaticus Y19 TaxID=1261127 RepID=A0A0F6TVA8_CITAM|nr:hypothetical protein [Citrobacter amalonaticus]AKE59372.1 hypothetical protein F384_12745 [Citrobacter amalonaticus Y19]